MNPEQINLIKNSFNNKKVFLTGHTGFKGSWLLSWLNSLGADIKGYSLAPDKNFSSLYEQINGDNLCTSIIADIRDEKWIKKEIKKFQPDYIFHLAAQPLVRISYNMPLETYETNIMGTAYILDALRELKKKCVGIIVTTDKVYENQEWLYPYRENEPLGGYDPYSSSKAACELVINSYRRSFFNPDTFQTHEKAIASVRAGNVIGGGDWAKDRIIPDMVKAFSSGKILNIRNPRAIRPWQHVLEPLGGYLLLGAKMYKDPSLGGAWNFGPRSDETVTVKELIELAAQHWKDGKVEYKNEENQPHEAGNLKLDISKAINLLNWHPVYNANQTIQLTVEWYKNKIIGGKDTLPLVLSQIKNYCS